MNTSSKNTPALLATLIAGAAAGALATWLLSGSQPAGDSAAQVQQEKKPLYWVAPMDPDYRRDEPGKSPMGMDLVPVYADGAAGDSPGTVSIEPEVVNNLGVRTANAQRETLAAVIRTVGYVKYDEDLLSHVHPRVQGWVDKLYVKASGDPVTLGQPLYELYSPELVNAQEELVLALGRNNTQLVGAAMDRLKALQVPAQFIGELRRSKQVRQSVTFYSPRDGVVDNLNIREGFYVMPGTMLMSIGALDPVWVEAEVFERQAAQVHVGDPVSMSLDYLPGRDWQGTVDYIYPSLDEKTRTLRVRLRFANDDGALRPNMFAQVVIRPPGWDALVVPAEAVIRTGDQDRVVLALGEGRFKSVAVHLGAVVDGRAEVLHGLAAGDTVVTSAQFLLDSESSKTSDFMRMLPAQDHGEHDQHAASGTQPDATDADRHAGHGGATP